MLIWAIDSSNLFGVRTPRVSQNKRNIVILGKKPSMNSTKKVCLSDGWFCSQELLELFTEATQKGQIAFKDWYRLMTEPLLNTLSEEEEDLFSRLIYAVRTGRLMVVDNR